MKKTVLPLCLLVLLITACQKQHSDLDEIMLPCYVTAYQKEGYDIKAIIDDYETLLVREGVLKERSGKSYKEILQKIYSDEDYSISVSPFRDFDPSNKASFATIRAAFECQVEGIKVLHETDPKWKNILSTDESRELIQTPEKVYSAMAETMSEADFYSYYHRFKMFQLLDGVNTHLRNRASMPSASTRSVE